MTIRLKLKETRAAVVSNGGNGRACVRGSTSQPSWVTVFHVFRSTCVTWMKAFIKTDETVWLTLDWACLLWAEHSLGKWYFNSWVIFLKASEISHLPYYRSTQESKHAPKFSLPLLSLLADMVCIFPQCSCLLLVPTQPQSYLPHLSHLLGIEPTTFHMWGKCSVLELASGSCFLFQLSKLLFSMGAWCAHFASVM